MIVADTCLIAHLFNETEKTKSAQDILEKDSDWIVPSLWQEEYANILSKLARKENRDIKQVLSHFQYTVEQLQDHECLVDNQQALEISIFYKISVYDSHFVSLALDFNVLLITEDKEVLKRCPKLALNMRDFLKI